MITITSRINLHFLRTDFSYMGQLCFHGKSEDIYSVAFQCLLWLPVAPISELKMDGLQMRGNFLTTRFNRLMNKIQNYYSNILKKWQHEEPEGDYFWQADIVTAVAGL